MSAAGGDLLFHRLVDVALPRGGVIVALAEVYVDESGTHDGSPLMCVAGYIFTSEQAKRFCDEWSVFLSKKGLPYFRMVDCAHGNGVFNNMPVADRDQIERTLIRTIKRRALYGFAVTINEADYRARVAQLPQLGGAYSFCLRACLTLVRSWAERANFDGRVAYFFEAGHKDEAEANRLTNATISHPDFRERFRYASHSFVGKADAAPLQAADLLGWLWRRDALRKRAGNGVSRKDLQALIRPQDRVIDYNESALASVGIIADVARRRASTGSS